MTNIIFPAYPGNNRRPEPSFQEEVDAAKKAGFSISLFGDTLFNTKPTLNQLSEGPHTNSIYRGWLLAPAMYKHLVSLASVLNTEEEYLYSYNFPNWYKDFEDVTPQSVYYDNNETPMIERLSDIATHVCYKFGNKPLIVKDFVKSRKHEWHDACFISSAGDLDEIIRVSKNFIERQDQDFYGGLVFREFIDFARVGIHPKTKLPLPREYRIFTWYGSPFYIVPYWSHGAEYSNETIDLTWLKAPKHVPLSAIDIAQDNDGKWWVVEINDGGAAGIPESGPIEEFYENLAISME